MTTPPMLRFMKELKLTQVAVASYTGFCLRMIGYLAKGIRFLRDLELYGLQYLWECHYYGVTPKKFGDEEVTTPTARPRKKKK